MSQLTSSHFVFKLPEKKNLFIFMRFFFSVEQLCTLSSSNLGLTPFVTTAFSLFYFFVILFSLVNNEHQCLTFFKKVYIIYLRIQYIFSFSFQDFLSFIFVRNINNSSTFNPKIKKFGNSVL